ncbi:MAG TPA: NADH-quinone oxidoreductase subunit C [bacterium]|nr:NADH-quinone oxidoreductase subunit C [bacterium]
MTSEQIQKKLAEFYKGVAIEFVAGAKNPVTQAQTGDSCLIVPADKIKDICKTLKTIDQFAFDCLSSLTAVDRPKENRFEVVYHLFSYKHKHTVVLKVFLPRDETAHVETLESLWSCANWLEREVYDLFGIKFDNHSDLRRIMLPDDWVGHPLRKDYKEQEDYHGISTTRPSLLS